MRKGSPDSLACGVGKVPSCGSLPLLSTGVVSNLVRRLYPQIYLNGFGSPGFLPFFLIEVQFTQHKVNYFKV